MVHIHHQQSVHMHHVIVSRNRAVTAKYRLTPRSCPAAGLFASTLVQAEPEYFSQGSGPIKIRNTHITSTAYMYFVFFYFVY